MCGGRVISPTPRRWSVVLPSSSSRMRIGPIWMASPPPGPTTRHVHVWDLLVVVRVNSHEVKIMYVRSSSRASRLSSW